MEQEMENNNVNTFDYRKALKVSTESKRDVTKWLDIYLNRPLAALIVRAVYNTRITPNGLTYFSFVLGLLGAFFFTRATYSYFILGGIFTQLSSIVDGADGMLARAKNMSSDYGSHLDLFFDRIVDFSLFVCLSLGASSYFNAPKLLFMGTLGAGLYLLQINLFYLTKSYLKVTDKGETGEMRAIAGWGILVFSVINRLDICIYLVLVETGIVNTVRFIYFIYLGRKKDSSVLNGFEHSQQTEPGKQQGNQPPD
jgi:phosphatidylglycerophosphate synthase